MKNILRIRNAEKIMSVISSRNSIKQFNNLDSMVMLRVTDQKLHFCESTVNEHAKLPCCTSQSLLEEFKLKMVFILDVTPGKSMFQY